MLDVTIVYEERSHSLWNSSAGVCDAAIVDVRELALPGSSSAATTDTEFRDRVQAWVRDLWAGRIH
jgi:hypothetical protein